MNRIVRNLAVSITSDGRLWARLFRGGLALLAALCLFILPTGANAACGRFDAPGLHSVIKFPAVPQAAFDFPSPFERADSIVGLWQVVYTNSADQSIFNETFDTWHGDGTEFESAFLAPAGGDVCVGVWRPTGERSVTLHHVGWLFNASTPSATASNIFTLDETANVSADGKSYSGHYTFKVWNLDGTATPVEVTGTMVAARITVN